MITAIKNIYESEALDKPVKKLALESHLVQKRFKLTNKDLITALRFIARQIELAQLGR